MDRESLTESLNRLWDGTIEEFDIDLCSHAISMLISVVYGEEVSQHKVVFENVASFYYVAEDGTFRFDSPAWERAELTEIVFRDGTETIQHTSKQPRKVPEYTTSANFVLGMWSSVLFVEAKSISIDGKRFEVGYPVTGGSK
ncbi:MAG TPA: hypothetical protein VJ123_10440 [Anaerolineales bacterium]|nr:hypothetical protein [Anaerolineales bacterium]